MYFDGAALDCIGEPREHRVKAAVPPHLAMAGVVSVVAALLPLARSRSGEAYAGGREKVLREVTVGNDDLRYFAAFGP
jgi:hypothetical protein